MADVEAAPAGAGVGWSDPEALQTPPATAAAGNAVRNGGGVLGPLLPPPSAPSSPPESPQLPGAADLRSIARRERESPTSVIPVANPLKVGLRVRSVLPPSWGAEVWASDAGGAAIVRLLQSSPWQLMGIAGALALAVSVHGNSVADSFYNTCRTDPAFPPAVVLLVITAIVQVVASPSFTNHAVIYFWLSICAIKPVASLLVPLEVLVAEHAILNANQAALSVAAVAGGTIIGGLSHVSDSTKLRSFFIYLAVRLAHVLVAFTRTGDWHVTRMVVFLDLPVCLTLGLCAARALTSGGKLADEGRPDKV